MDINKILDAIKPFGIEFTEGVISETEEKGKYGPYIQSKRQDIYKAYAKKLIEEGKAYASFLTKEELVEHFVEIRLNKYNERKDRLVSIMEKKFKDNDDICRFIELVNAKKIIITNRKTKDIKEDLKKHNLPDTVLSVQISKLTDEEKKELLKKNEQIKKELEYIKSTTIKDMYLNDLKQLKKLLITEF